MGECLGTSMSPFLISAPSQHNTAIVSIARGIVWTRKETQTSSAFPKPEEKIHFYFLSFSLGYFSIFSLAYSIMLALGFLGRYYLSSWGNSPLFPVCWEFLIMRECGKLSDAFSALIDVVMWLFSFWSLFMWWLTFLMSLMPKSTLSFLSGRERRREREEGREGKGVEVKEVRGRKRIWMRMKQGACSGPRRASGSRVQGVFLGQEVIFVHLGSWYRVSGVFWEVGGGWFFISSESPEVESLASGAKSPSLLCDGPLAALFRELSAMS